MEKDNLDRKVKGDGPLSSLRDDEFGLGEMVEGVAGMLASRTPDQGFRIGIEGPWGSGKSTFANFVAERLVKYEDHAVIRFEPWLVGEKSALIACFLGLFASEIDRISPSNGSGGTTDDGRQDGELETYRNALESTEDI